MASRRVPGTEAVQGLAILLGMCLGSQSFSSSLPEQNFAPFLLRKRISLYLILSA